MTPPVYDCEAAGIDNPRTLTVSNPRLFRSLLFRAACFRASSELADAATSAWEDVKAPFALWTKRRSRVMSAFRAWHASFWTWPRLRDDMNVRQSKRRRATSPRLECAFQSREYA